MIRVKEYIVKRNKNMESRFGRNPVLGVIPFQEGFFERNPVWEEFRSGGIPVGRSSMGGIIWEEICTGGIPMEPWKL